MKESYAKEYKSGIKDTYEKNNLLHILQEIKFRNQARFDAIPCLVGSDLATKIRRCEDVAISPRKKIRKDIPD